MRNKTLYRIERGYHGAPRRSVVTSDAGLLAYRELDDAGKNGRHALVGLLRQSVFGRLAG
jgi:hypothetical protein